MGRYFAKVVTGALAKPQRMAFGTPFSVRSTRVEGGEIVAEEDSLIALFVESTDVPENVSNIESLAIEGDYPDAFQWRSFGERFGAVIPAFSDVDAYMCGGFHLLDSAGSEICYVNLWCAGQGVNLTTHNHAHPPQPLAPAFAEVHWVFNNGTGTGGMYSADHADGAKTATYPLGRGEEHGPFFAIDDQGKHKLRPSGVVEYPWHGWESGVDDTRGQTYDVVAAFEINPEYAKV